MVGHLGCAAPTTIHPPARFTLWGQRFVPVGGEPTSGLRADVRFRFFRRCLCVCRFGAIVRYGGGVLLLSSRPVGWCASCVCVVREVGLGSWELGGSEEQERSSCVRQAGCTEAAEVIVVGRGRWTTSYLAAWAEALDEDEDRHSWAGTAPPCGFCSGGGCDECVGSVNFPGTGGGDPESMAIREWYRGEELAGRAGRQAGVAGSSGDHHPSR